MESVPWKAPFGQASRTAGNAAQAGRKPERNQGDVAEWLKATVC
jgi:hypothetical protein